MGKKKSGCKDKSFMFPHVLSVRGSSGYVGTAETSHLLTPTVMILSADAVF